MTTNESVESDCYGRFTIRAAIGDTITVASNIDSSTFGAPVTFGVNNTFTLGAAEDIYAGIFMSKSAGTGAPIPFVAVGGDTGLIRYGIPIVPVVGNSPSGGTLKTTGLGRHYDYQITTSLVPEPVSFVLMAVFGLVGLVVRRRRRG